MKTGDVINAWCKSKEWGSQMFDIQCAMPGLEEGVNDL